MRRWSYSCPPDRRCARPSSSRTGSLRPTSLVGWASGSTPAKRSRSETATGAARSTSPRGCAPRRARARSSPPKPSSTWRPGSTGSAMSSLGPSGSRALPSRSGRSGSSPRVGCRAGSADGCAALGSGAASAPFCSWVEWPSSPSQSSSRRSGERSRCDRARHHMHHRMPPPACRRRLPRRDRRAAPGWRSSMPRAGASRPSTRASADRSTGSGSATGCGCMTPIRRRSTASILQRARSISRSRPRSTSPTGSWTAARSGSPTTSGRSFIRSTSSPGARPTSLRWRPTRPAR